MHVNDLRQPKQPGQEVMNSDPRLLDEQELDRVREQIAAGHAIEAVTGAQLLDHIAALRKLAGLEDAPMVETSGGPVRADFFNSDALQQLTRRQMQIVGMIRGGLTNTEIAGLLGITVGTTKVHITAIMKALGVRNRVQTAIAAELLGIAPFGKEAAGPAAEPDVEASDFVPQRQAHDQAGTYRPMR